MSTQAGNSQGNPKSPPEQAQDSAIIDALEVQDSMILRILALPPYILRFIDAALEFLQWERRPIMLHVSWDWPATRLSPEAYLEHDALYRNHIPGAWYVINKIALRITPTSVLHIDRKSTDRRCLQLYGIIPFTPRVANNNNRPKMLRNIPF